VLRLTLFAIFELKCFAKNVLLKSRPNAKPQTVGCNRPAQNDEENLKNKTKKTIYDN
jgi:hypothetical protein